MTERSAAAAGSSLARRVLVAMIAALVAGAWWGSSSASAAVSYVGSQSGNGNCSFILGCTANAQVSVPAGTANGDLMIATVQFQQSVLGLSGYTAAGGWTLLRSNTNGSGGGYVYYRIASGEPSSYTWSDGFLGLAGSVAVAAEIDVYSGNDTTTPLSSGAQSTGSGTAVTLPNDTASYAGSMRISSVASYSTGSTTSTSAFQSGLTLADHAEASNGNAANVAAAYVAQGSGATTSYTDTLSNSTSGWLATTYVINPFAQKVAFTTQPVGGVGEGVSFPTQPVVKVQDAAGATDAADTSTVTLAIASGPGGGVLSCTGGLSKAAVAGVATFSGCQITGTPGAGTYTLSATDGSLTPATSSGFTIAVGAATKLAITTQPVGGVAEGVNLATQPVVSVEDANGNVVSTDSSSVTLTKASGPGAGAFACTTNPLAASSGVATFAGCKITGTAAAGSYTLTATDGALTSATTSSFTITAGAASKLAITTQPVGGVGEGVNLPTQPAVTVEDSYGNVVTSDSSSVTLAKASGPAGGSLACTSNPLAASSGVATFAGCQITGTAGAGSYTLTATDGALTSATTSSFTISVGAAAKLAITTQPVGGVAEGVNLGTQPGVSVEDAYGNVVTTDSSSVTLAKASGPAAGSFACTSNPLAASSGVATFAGCQITGTAAAGSYTLTATDGALTSATTSSFTINVGAAAKLAITTQPVGGVAEGVNLGTQPVVSVEDAYGNVVTGNSSSVTLTKASGPGAGSLSCTSNPLAASAGVATFAACKITGTAAVGSYTLTATDGALTSATTSSFTIIAGAASKLAITTQPVGGVTEGVNLATQPVVSVEDAYGNVVTTDSSSVMLATASGPGAGLFTCTSNPQPASAGVATFAGCRMTGTAAAGTYTLTATDGALTAATTSSFTITVGAAAKLAFTTQPGGGVLFGVLLLTQPAVSVEDAYGNVVTGDSSTVSLSIGSGPAAGSLSCLLNSLGAILGVATFVGCDIGGSGGNYTLTATDGALASATSTVFTIAGTLGLTGSSYSFNPITLNGFDQTTTATLSFDVADTTGLGAGWNVAVATSGWSGGTHGSLASAETATSQPSTATCDGGTGTCTPAVPAGSLTWPMAFGSTPTVVYDATVGTGLAPQTVHVPLALTIPANTSAVGTFTQTVTLTVVSGP